MSCCVKLTHLYFVHTLKRCDKHVFMRLLTKTVLACLLMFAIPIQGFAASAMLICAPSHHAVVATTVGQQTALHHHTNGTEQVQRLQDNKKPGSHHGQEAGKSLANSPFDDAADKQVTPLKIGKLAGGDCSACATCCTGSVVVSIQSMNHVAMTGSVLIPIGSESYVSYIPEGFDPPPRFILA